MNAIAEIEKYERDFADPVMRKNIAYMTGLIAEQFEEFASSGQVIKKADVLAWLPNSSDKPYQISDFSAKQLSDTAILATYKTVIGDKVDRRSSVWLLQDKKWQLVHHQATSILINV